MGLDARNGGWAEKGAPVNAVKRRVQTCQPGSNMTERLQYDDNTVIGIDTVTPPCYTDGMGFTKLFQSIVHSTIWREPMHVKIVWVTLLAMANRRGYVAVSVPGLADLAKVSLEQCVEALERLKSPDPWSRTKEHGGRRVLEDDGGFLIINYEKYRNMIDEDARRIDTRERVRRFREKRKTATVTDGNTDMSKCNDIAEAEAEAEAEGVIRSTYHPDFLAFWEAYPSRGASGNPKKLASDAYRRAQERDGVAPETILTGVQGYATWCRIRGWVKTPFVAQAVTWLNQSRWEADYTIGYNEMLKTITDEVEREDVSRRITLYLEGR